MSNNAAIVTLCRKLLAAAFIIIAALALTAGYRLLAAEDLKPIGGEWYIKSESAYRMGHSSRWDVAVQR